MKFGGLLAGILTLCVTLFGIGILMTGSFFGQRRHSAPMAHETADAVAQEPMYSGPLPTGMVGLVTVGAQAVGIGTPRASMPTPSTSASRSSATTSAATDATAGVTPVVLTTAPGVASATTSQEGSGVQPAATTAAGASPMPTFTWPYQWPSWHPGG